MWRTDELHAGLRLNEYAESARRFVWNELADWYLEAVKARLADAGRRPRGRARGARARVRQRAPPAAPDRAVRDGSALAAPARASEGRAADSRGLAETRQRATNRAASKEFELVRETVLAVRQIRGDNAVAPGKSIEVMVRPASGDGLSALFDRERRHDRPSHAVRGDRRGDTRPAARRHMR